MKPFRSCCAFVATACLTISQIAFCANVPQLADRVPDDAVFCIAWNGAEAFANAPEYQQSHIKGLLDNSNMRQVASDLLPKLLAKAAKEGGPEAAEAVDAFKMIGGSLWNYPTAAYFTIEMGNGNPMPHAAIFCRAGKDAMGIQKRLDDLLAQANPPAEAAVRTFVVDDVVGISVGFDDGAMSLAGADGKTKPITQSDGFKVALAKLGGGDASFIRLLRQRPHARHRRSARSDAARSAGHREVSRHPRSDRHRGACTGSSLRAGLTGRAGATGSSRFARPRKGFCRTPILTAAEHWSDDPGLEKFPRRFNCQDQESTTGHSPDAGNWRFRANVGQSKIFGRRLGKNSPQSLGDTPQGCAYHPGCKNPGDC